MAISYDKLLYPELLNNEELIQIIHERHLRLENIEIMSRCELIELFRNFCIPHGQRKYRDSGRGKVLNKSRRLSSEPATKVTDHHQSNYSIEVQNFNNNNDNNRKVPHSNLERLKPPPDILSGCMKRIKLDNNIMWKETDNNSKRKMSIDSLTATTDSPPAKKDRKLITWP